ncbi:hypothetical protein [Tritonibacter mobilis]|uniref:hypothetical protein n=2 Tax=Tritonibacter mobilis TaxID=379347 RepID=UPI0039A4A4E6
MRLLYRCIAVFGILAFGADFAMGPSFITSLLGADAPNWGDGFTGSMLWLADRYWNYISGTFVVLTALNFAIMPRSKRRWPAAH